MTTITDHADALAEALDEALATLDPDGDDHPDLLIPLQQYRLYRLESAGQTALDLGEPGPLERMQRGEDPLDPEACLETTP